MFAVLLPLHIFLHVLGVTGRANADIGDFGQIHKDVEDKRLEKIEELMEEYIKRIRDLENTVKIQNNAIQELQENVNLLKIENRECEKTKKEFINSNEPKSDFRETPGNTREKRLLIGSTPLPITKRTTSFYAYMKTHEPNPGIHHTFIFDVVKVNINGGYSPYSGVFTAPEEGVYVFTYSLRAKCNSYS